MKRTLLFILVCLSASLLKAQQVSGRLVDSNNKPVGYANVVLQQADSTFVKGCTTDAKGLFDLQASTTGQYRLVISYIGYETLAIDLSLPRGKKRLGDITLMEAAETLGEVQVVGARTIQKIDRQVIVPSQSQLESSSTSYQLLNKLMLPNLTVDVIQNNVQTDDGGSVEFRINGVKVSHNQVMSLNTRRVERVEYIDNPGVRYGNTDVKAVINYIVKQRDDGYEGGVFANNAAYKPGIFGNNNLFGYVNKGNSQWGLEYSMGYRDYDNRRQNSTQEFLTDTNQKRTREQQGIDMPFGYTQHQIEASYTYNKVDNRMFRAVFSDEIWRTDKQDFASIIRETNCPDIYSKTHISDHYQAPALDLYAEWNLPHNQTLMFNAVGTYISSDFSRDYRESLLSNGDMLSNYAYSTDGNHYSFIFEGNYDRSWGSTTLSIGAKESMSYTNNEYTGINEAGLNMHTNNLYGYAQLQGRLSKLNYFVGAGVARDEFSRGSKGYTFVTFRPSVSLYLPLFSGAGLRYFFNVFSYTPSLSQLSEVSQQLSDFEYSIGNEQLSPYRGYQHYVTLSWRIKNISTSLSFYSIVNHDPIITKSEREGTGEDAMFIYRWINADRFSQLGSILNLRWNILPDKLSLNLKGRVNRYNTRGEGFDYKYTWWSGTASVDYTAKQWTFSASASSRMNRLSGEEISYGEKNSAITAGYRLNKHLDLSLMWMYPLQAQGWTAGSKNLSDLTPNRKWTRIKENGNMITLMVYWRFNGGRSFNRGNKQLNNSDRDSGIAK
jgi:hypothetical protein